MPIVQQASGTFTSSFTASLPGASSAANAVVLTVAANTTITTPTNWTLRTSQVNFMGHYMLDRKGTSLTSVSVTAASGVGTWWIAEITDGTYDTATSANNTAPATSYTTPALTPAAGTRIIIASIGSVYESTPAARTVSGWTNSFIEQADVCQPSADYPMQGVAILDSVAANGSTAYSTGATYSANSSGRSALIGSYVTSAGAAPAASLLYSPHQRLLPYLAR